ncbi:hypothetical protein A0H81_13482 [Grifola frondosa]|uniref:DUF7082 domain-containing protein n=1 Tax=Grifola frondosa TaxID=5627 RepID=A0A1C7LRA6_GRIFR|nr:hypothetical protein A0H81_13482 [Grifola frondosa]
MTLVSGSQYTTEPPAVQDMHNSSSSHTRDPFSVYSTQPYANQGVASDAVSTRLHAMNATARSVSGIVSPRGMLRVYTYDPMEGPAGISITVTLSFHLTTMETTYLRLVVGNKALTTKVRPLAADRRFVPGCLSHLYSTPRVLRIPKQESMDSPLALFSSPPLSGRHAPTDDKRLTSPSSSSGSRKAVRSPPGAHARIKEVQSPRQQKKQSLIRARRSGTDEEVPDEYRAALKLLTEPERMSKGWDDEEIHAGRRLVRFSRTQEGSTLIVSCEALKQEDYVEGEMVVSCIYRPDTDSCCITSVDIIFLLESIVGDIFNIEEKNRIRRNLEGFRPKTPRNIEKDVKVFEWALLPQALDKIISKYTLYPIVQEQRESRPSTAPARNLSSSSSTTPDSAQSCTSSPKDYMSPKSMTSDSSNLCFPELTYPSESYADSIESRRFTSPISDGHVSPPYVRNNTASSYGLAHSSMGSPKHAIQPGARDVTYAAAGEVALVTDPDYGLYHTAASAHAGLSEASYHSSDSFGFPSGMNQFDSVEFQTLREHKLDGNVPEPYV